MTPPSIPSREPWIAVLDIETQFLFDEVPNRAASELKVAVAGVKLVYGGSYARDFIFLEDNVGALLKLLDQSDIIVGHNLLGFDYEVLRPYADFDPVERLGPKTIDTLARLRVIVGRRVSLDELARLNFSAAKAMDSKLIPGLWRSGHHEKVIEHLKTDLWLTARLFVAGSNGGTIKIRGPPGQPDIEVQPGWGVI